MTKVFVEQPLAWRGSANRKTQVETRKNKRNWKMQKKQNETQKR